MNQNIPVPTTKDAAFEAVVACGKLTSALSVAAEITGSAAIDDLCEIALEMTDRLARLCAALGSDAQPSYIACAGSMPCDFDEGRLRAECRKLVDDYGDEVRSIVRKVDGLFGTAPRPERCAVSVRADVAYAMR